MRGVRAPQALFVSLSPSESAASAEKQLHRTAAVRPERRKRRPNLARQLAPSERAALANRPTLA